MSQEQQPCDDQNQNLQAAPESSAVIDSQMLTKQLTEKEQLLQTYTQQAQQHHDQLHSMLSKLGMPVDDPPEQQSNEELCFPEDHVIQLFEAVEKSKDLQEKLQERMLRLQADFDNFRKRTRQEKAEWADTTTAEVLQEFLPVVDNFERALVSAQQQNADSEFASGVEMIFRQFKGVLEKLGVTAIEAINQPFDPNLHEAVMREVDESIEVDTVVQQLQTGYLYKTKTLRPSMVKVASKS